MTNKPGISVTHYYREPRDTGLSIEGIFKTVYDDLQLEADIINFYCDAKLSRLQNIKRARQFSSKVNHITGDVNFLALGLAGKKNILTIHDFGYYENPIHSKFRHFIYKTFWFTLPLRNIDIVTVVSAFTKEKLMRYFNFPESKIRVIPDPVKPVFKFSEKKEFSEKPVVLMLGTGKHKNLDGLIEATRDLPVHLEIVGWPATDELAKLKEYGTSYAISNKLTDTEVHQKYVQCDLLYIASFYEGFGMPIIEAQTVGRPVITSGIGAMAEVAGESALLVHPTDISAIRENVIRLITDSELYFEIVEKGIANAARFDHKTISLQYLEVYKELANS